MYRDCFKLRCKPFGNTPDPEFFYFSMDHRQALITVSRAIKDRCGLILLLGDVGTGKTTICQHVHNHSGYKSAYLNYPFLTESEFLETVNREMGIPVGDGSRKSSIDELDKYLKKRHQKGKPAVLIIDEAHRLALPIFDEILSLSNLQLFNTHLLQIVLAGQSALLDTLRHPRLRSLNQRIGVRYNLQNMDRASTMHYISHRLGKAGCTDLSLFSKSALDSIWKASQGTPRLVNQLGDRALNEAYQKGKKRVGKREVKQIVKDPLYQPLFAAKVRSWSMRAAYATTAFSLLFCLSLGLWYLGSGSRFISEIAGIIGRVPVEHRAMVRHPIIIPSPGTAPVASGKMAAEETVVVAASEAVTPERPDLLAYQTSQADSITEPLLAETDLPDLRLNAIAWDENPGRSIAVLNEKILHEGEFLGDVRVLRINPDHVVLICGKEHVIKRIHPPIPGMSPEATVEHSIDENYEAEASDPTEESSEETAYFLADFRPIINFDYKTSDLTSEAYEELDSIATILERSDKCEIVLRGYTDDVGPKGYNRRLSESRANIVRRYLVGKGISPDRITIIGMGEKNPLRPNTTDEGRAANRRVEIEFVPDSDY